MKRMRLLSLLLALVLVCTAMPVTAAAADGLANATVCTTHTVHTEGQSAEDCTGLAPYLAPDGTAWAAVGDDTTKVKTWHCFQQDIDAALTDALHRMLRRETAFTLYIAVKKAITTPPPTIFRRRCMSGCEATPWQRKWAPLRAAIFWTPRSRTSGKMI